MTETITDVPVVTDDATEVQTDTATQEVVEGEVVSDVVEDEVKNKRNTKRAATKAQKDAAAKDKPVSKAVAVRKADKPVEKSELTPAAAKKLTEQLRKGLEHSVDLYKTAYSKRIWLALGHATWIDYLNAELGELRPKLPKDSRQEFEVELLEVKMSSRAIAGVIGVDQKTVVNDLAELRANGTIAVESTRVVGTDGVEQAGEKAEKPVDPEKLAAKFNAKIDNVFDKLDKYVGDLTELAGEDEFENLAAEVATRHRADVARLLDSLLAFQNLIQ